MSMQFVGPYSIGSLVPSSATRGLFGMEQFGSHQGEYVVWMHDTHWFSFYAMVLMIFDLLIS